MEGNTTDNQKTYSVLVERTVKFWQEVDIEASSLEEVAELAELAESKCCQYDFACCQETEVTVKVRDADGEWIDVVDGDW